MHEKIKAGVDLDGVYYDFVDAYDDFLRLHGHKIDITRFDRGVLKDSMKDYYLERFSNTRPFLWIPQDENAIESLRFASQYVDWYAVTARNHRMKYAEEDTIVRLKKDNFPCKEIIFEPDKAKIAKELGLAYFVEDNLQNARDIVEKTSCKVCLVEKTYNQFNPDLGLNSAIKNKINRLNEPSEFANFVLNDSGILIRTPKLISVPGLV